MRQEGKAIEVLPWPALPSPEIAGLEVRDGENRGASEARRARTTICGFGSDTAITFPQGDKRNR